MNANLSEQELEGFIAMVDEDTRVGRLSARALVFECLESNLQDEVVIEEMMTRLFPDWAYQSKDGNAIEPRPKRIYVAGPMTGYDDLNYPAFAATAQVLRNGGYEVISPAEINPPETEYRDAMVNDINALLTCDEIWMMPGWTKSKGAMLEFQIANCIGLRIRGEL